MRPEQRALVLSIVIAVLTAPAAAPAASQEVRASALRGSTDHDLLDSPDGFGVEAGWNLGARLAVRAGYARYHDEFVGFGTTCAGLLPPGVDCTPEFRDQTARVEGVVVALAATIFATESIRLNIVPDARVMDVATEQRGQETGRERSATKRMLGAALGGEAIIEPVRAWGLRFHIGAHRGVLTPYVLPTIVDGYTPFEAGIGLEWLEAGASLAFE
ncbi:MAG: hypothetical protein ACODAE_00855 [Gemmatimonadota bacterium]